MSDSANGRFVHEVPLVVDFSTERELRVRFEVARRLYNALLGEAMRRIRRVRHELRRSSFVTLRADAKAAIESAKAAGVAGDDLVKFRKDAYAGYNEARTGLLREHGCSRYGLGYYATELSRATPRWAPGHALGATIVQMLSARAWRAAEKALRDSRTRVRFVRLHEGVTSVESMHDSDAIRLGEDYVIWSSGRGGGVIRMRMRLDRKGRDVVEQYARQQKIVQTRIMRRKISGRWRYAAQLVLAGTPAPRPWLAPSANVAPTSTIGIDLGLSIVAVDSDAESAIYSLTTTTTEQRAALALKQRRTMRALDRSRRATNPRNYDGEGRIVARSKRTRWQRSKQYERLQAEYAEASRVMTEQRKLATRTLANAIARNGYMARIEDLSYASWVREYGRAKGFAPGAFAAALDRAIARHDGRLVKFAASAAKLSQACHECGHYEKRTFAIKVLDRRQHCSACGSDHGGVQADLYQAFLARFVAEGTNTVELPEARRAFAGASTRLAAASSAVFNAAKSVFGRSRPYREASRRAVRAEESVAAEIRSPIAQEPASSRRGKRANGVAVEVHDNAGRAPRWGDRSAGALDRLQRKRKRRI